MRSVGTVVRGIRTPIIKDDTEKSSNARAQKKQKKEPKLTDKTKKLKRK